MKDKNGRKLKLKRNEIGHVDILVSDKEEHLWFMAYIDDDGYLVLCRFISECTGLKLNEDGTIKTRYEGECKND